MTPRNPDYIQRTFEATVGQPFARLIGVETAEIGPGWVEIFVTLAPHHLQQDNIVHGGAIATLADTCLAMAAHTLVAGDERVVTIEFKINYLRAATGDRLRCRGQALRPGRTITTSEAEIYAEENGHEKLVAKALGTIAILPPQSV
ncbi:hypothetical protein CCAX7_64480 [Capsulimonas corticalis]|uniref:Thioesterase domain-containing protein n=1 Tax=Capsulimonas corticalis TaxID=2219043 RepID=A0A402CR17_9BACT|nr:PaaI family thioesterase [Capsulimonas corticalis]BDI34397.1 hypothetical protein CCAX7_64480 [Capsulimonas corticalis]